MDFIITSLQSWHEKIGTTIRNTALEIAKRHRVIYVNTPATLIDRLHGVKKCRPPYLQPVNSNLWVLECPFAVWPVNRLPSALFKMANYLNNQKIARWIASQAATLHFKDSILLIDNDIYRSRYLKQFLRPALSIYYRRDYVIGFDYWKKHGPSCEQELVRASDLVITNSSYFTKELSPYNARIYTTNTGVNLQLYDAARPYDTPSDIRDIPRPIIGYTGALIETRLDIELLYKLARQLSQYSFVLVGPEDDCFRQHPLHTLPNVHFTGQKRVEELPAYIRQFDVCINPQKLNPITIGNYPLKVDEYLAMGKPVVATRTHTMEDVFARHTHLATDCEGYVSAIQTALQESSNAQLKEERIAFAHTHDWAHSVEKIYKAIDQYLTEKSSSASAR